jgi:hypothetical protein
VPGQQVKASKVEKIRLELTGTTELLMHNEQLADPDNEFTKQIAALTGKREKTDEDRKEIAKLEWFGGIYADATGPYVPSRNLKRCIAEAAKSSNNGKTIDRALIISEQVNIPLLYKGSRNVPDLFEISRHRHACLVKVSNKKIMRHRPQFPEWGLEAEYMLQTNLIDFRKFTDLVQLAGIIEGLGDGRRFGCGRFTAEVHLV